MRRLPSMLLPIVLMAPLAACSNGDAKATKSPTPRVTATACTESNAVPTREFKIGSTGISPTCASFKKGTQVFFVNDSDDPVDATLAGSGADDFSTQLATRAATFVHIFETAGSYTVTSTSGPAATLIVTP